MLLGLGKVFQHCKPLAGGKAISLQIWRRSSLKFPSADFLLRNEARSKPCCLYGFTERICQQQPPFQRLIHFPPTQKAQNTPGSLCGFLETWAPVVCWGWRALGKEPQYSLTAQKEKRWKTANNSSEPCSFGSCSKQFCYSMHFSGDHHLWIEGRSLICKVVRRYRRFLLLLLSVLWGASGAWGTILSYKQEMQTFTGDPGFGAQYQLLSCWMDSTPQQELNILFWKA